jgi:hypothetical protein
MVTASLFFMRLHGWPRGVTTQRRPEEECLETSHSVFSLGRWGVLVNVLAVLWGLFVVVNMSWPRPEIYGTDAWGRYAALISTAALFGLGSIYYFTVTRHRTGVLSEHSVAEDLEGAAIDLVPWPVPADS